MPLGDTSNLAFSMRPVLIQDFCNQDLPAFSASLRLSEKSVPLTAFNLPANLFTFAAVTFLPAALSFSLKHLMRHQFLLSIILFSVVANAQQLQPGFDKKEYIELLKVSAQSTGDTGYIRRQPPPERFRLVYRSQELGLDNRYDLWSDDACVALISIRGTTRSQISWLENFYAAMTPARGTLELPGGESFPYDLSPHPRAAVHAGWLLGMAFLGRDMLPKLDSAYRSGTRNLLIMGHSQGGAIAYLLTAYLRQRQATGTLPADWTFKTYCSAAPKPGNLQFAYSYEAATQGGWAFNVVNSADWVPETPVSLQTLDDFNPNNPFSGAQGTISNMRFPQKIALRHVYNRLNKSTVKARKTYIKYLGGMTGKQVRKVLKGMELPPNFNSIHYVRAGQFVVLQPDSSYLRQYPDASKNVFAHHLHRAYLELARQLPDSGNTATMQPRSGLGGGEKPAVGGQ